VAQAQSIGNLVRKTGGPRQDLPQALPTPAERAFAAIAAEQAEPMNENQKALVAFTEYLESQIAEPSGKRARARAMSVGPPGQAAAAKERVELFLAQQKAKAASAPPE
jgi:hypothetical protein